MTPKKTGTGSSVRRTGRTRSSRRRSLSPQPILMGGIDIGSSALRMNIAEYLPDAESPIRIIEELSHPVATGADTFRHGHILPETLHSILHVLGNFLRLLDDYDVQHRRAVASSAIREAANREILVDRIRHEHGLEVEILDAVEESRLAYQALLPWLRQYQGGYTMALNIGGGSTEIMILRGEDLQLGGAKRLGTSRLFHSAGQGGSQSRAEILETVAANIVNSSRDSYSDYNIARLLLINRLLHRAMRNDPAAERQGGTYVMPSDAVRERLRNTYSLNPLEIGRVFNLGMVETELIIPAMLILDNFLAVTEVPEVTFTNTEMLTGLLTEMGMTVSGVNPLMSFRRQMIRSARAVGEKYNYDRAHARVVTEYSLRLFDALREMLDLEDRDRLLLELSAVLHDVGMYISEHRHHRHSAYLIKWSDIVGLNENDRILASQIAFFHRVEVPSADHPEYMALSRCDRMRVSKLAGILRMADVLDRGHRQSVQDLRAEATGDKLVLYLQMTGDMGIILDALPKKADLLEQVTGLQVILRREIPKL